jgi:Cu(I)/Ag(I) efflux system membrane fusion protein
MKKQLLTIALFMTFGISSMSLMAQDHDHSKMDMDHDMPKTASHEVDAKFQEQLNAVFQESLKLNTSFMTEDITEIKTAALNVKGWIEKVDMMLLKGQAHMDWMNYLNAMNNGLDQIASASSIANQRSAFMEYNTGLYQSIKAFGIGQEAFYQFCPMANNNSGAYWLSDSKEIRNPYMGEKMPTCGAVKETLN